MLPNTLFWGLIVLSLRRTREHKDLTGKRSPWANPRRQAEGPQFRFGYVSPENCVAFPLRSGRFGHVCKNHHQEVSFSPALAVAGASPPTAGPPLPGAEEGRARASLQGGSGLGSRWTLFGAQHRAGGVLSGRSSHPAARTGLAGLRPCPTRIGHAWCPFSPLGGNGIRENRQEPWCPRQALPKARGAGVGSAGAASVSEAPLPSDGSAASGSVGIRSAAPGTHTWKPPVPTTAGHVGAVCDAVLCPAPSAAGEGLPEGRRCPKPGVPWSPRPRDSDVTASEGRGGSRVLGFASASGRRSPGPGHVLCFPLAGWGHRPDSH